MRYAGDLLSRFPNPLHAWPVLAAHAHARLLRLDLEAALGSPGVVATLTGADVPGQADTGPLRLDEPLFPTEIQFHGQPVAWVLGESLDAARAGASLVRADYEPLPAVLTIEQAIQEGTFLYGPVRLRDGGLSALESSPLRFTGELRIGGQEHFYLETQSAIAHRDESGGMAVWSSTQHPSETQAVVARVLGWPRNLVTVECPGMGGAFGGKETQANSWAAIAALGALKSSRPVSVRLSRELDMVLTGKRHPFLARYEAGFESGGRLRAVRIQLYSDGGWSLDLSAAVLSRAMFHCDNAYRLPAVEIEGWVCRTNKTSQTAFRGFGGPQGMLVIEEILDQAARRLGLAPESVRERNFYRGGDRTHYGQPVRDCDRISRIWSTLKETSAFAIRREQIRSFNAASPEVKHGLAITPVKFGISFTATHLNQAGALVLIYQDGSVQVNHGGTEMGQGLTAKIRKIAAIGLGTGEDAIRVMPARTDKVPNTSATAASASTDLNGAAVLDACRQLRCRLQPFEMRLQESGRNAEFSDLVKAAYLERVPLFAQGFYRTPDIGYDPATMRGTPFQYFVWGAAVAEVEVDSLTGVSRLLRADLLQDAGDPLIPIIDRGQIEGGFLQGVGWLTIEELSWDDQGRVATKGASTYKLPTLHEMPLEFHAGFLERATEARTVSGAKAVGEPPLMLAISVREAIRDAIAAFGGNGPVEIGSPATPERIFFAIRKRIGA